MGRNGGRCRSRRPRDWVGPVVALAAGLGLVLEALPASGAVSAPREVRYRVVHTYPHDTTAFTEGLIWQGNFLYESTGLFGASTLRRVDLQTGAVLQMVASPPDEFGEGLALADRDRLAQLNLDTNHGFVYDRQTFAVVGEFHYDTAGWGLASMGDQLVMSDGSDRLTFLDPDTFQPVGTLSVTFAGEPLGNLNELEFIRGEIWANVFPTDRIVRINPRTGKVTSFLDLSRIVPPGVVPAAGDVPNGIAYDRATNRIFVTGKRWPSLFQIRVRG